MAVALQGQAPAPSAENLGRQALKLADGDQFARAVAEQEEAVKLDASPGGTSAMRDRLQLYRERRPYRSGG